MSSYAKDPAAVLDYRVDWAKWLPAGDTLASSTWEVPTGLEQAAQGSTHDATSATVWLAGGTNGTDYDVTNHITTAQGRATNQTIRIVVRDR